MNKVANFMEKASKAYYDGTPIISNEEYDALEAIHGQIISGNGDTSHPYRMFSLRKHYAEDGSPPIPKALCLKTPKLDGAAISIVYIDGDLSHAVTRGNGIMGRDVTDKVKLLVPNKVDIPGVAQITGEVVASSSMENSRNYASGALNQKHLKDFQDKVSEGEIIFVAYNVQVKSGSWGICETYAEDLHLLSQQGFTVVNRQEGFDKYPKDGEVYRLQSNKEFNQQGFTDKFPRGAYAFKEAQEEYVTELVDVIWQTGKSGKVTPVALLAPVKIEDAMVSRATLNNIAYIGALGLEIGCRVRVIRSGEIIPKIVGRL